MKDTRPKLIGLLKEGYCTPQIARMAKKLQEPSTTLQYNIKKLEEEGAIKAYKAIFSYKKIDEGFVAFLLINLAPEEYGDPEKIGKEISKLKEIESVDIVTGGWELLVKVRTKDQETYYQLVKNVISRKGINKITTITSLMQLKSEFVAGQ
ncbi:Lrp/AsnC family transcriptional regulator [Candidatus Woesearchaeota archaeon]|nr:Lrp/AsnC family transcriptional regulator [Candidatus Woesearchaeota archaeon]